MGNGSYGLDTARHGSRIISMRYANGREIAQVWIDPDDAPELTEEFFEQATPMIGDKVVSKDEFKRAAKTALRGRPPVAAPRKAINISGCRRIS